MEYRALERNEKVLKGDEYRVGPNTKWSTSVTPGLSPHSTGYEYRRPIAISSDTAPVVDKLMKNDGEDTAKYLGAMTSEFEGLIIGFSAETDLTWLTKVGFPSPATDVIEGVYEAKKGFSFQPCIDGWRLERSDGTIVMTWEQWIRGLQTERPVPDTSESQEWEESGLPSVGTICEARPTSEDSYCIAKTLLHDGGWVAFVGMQSGNIYPTQKLFWSVDYRPIQPTPEQKAAADEVDEICYQVALYKGDPKGAELYFGLSKHLYDAGCRLTKVDK